METIFVTGGAGFIGSAVCRHLIREGYRVANVDKLTYSGNLESLREIGDSPNYRFYAADICDDARMLEIMRSKASTGSCTWRRKPMSIARSTGPLCFSKPTSWARSDCSTPG
jgi:dTDP-D-glucose 4,6-dehydratase